MAKAEAHVAPRTVSTPHDTGRAGEAGEGPRVMALPAPRFQTSSLQSSKTSFGI